MPVPLMRHMTLLDFLLRLRKIWGVLRETRSFGTVTRTNEKTIRKVEADTIDVLKEF